MFDFIKRKIADHRLKRTFKEYGYNLMNLQFEHEGNIQYAQWQHPYIGQRIITQDNVNFFKRFVKKGSLAIDIGANSGDTTVPLALAVGREGLVLAFEPNPYPYKILKVNAELNIDKTNIVPLNLATTAIDGEFTFGSGDASYGNGGIIGFTSNIAKNTRYTFNVQGRNLEKLLQDNYPTWMDKLTLLKLDTEGYDKEILKTIPNILKNSRPTIIAECFRQLNKTERQELFDVLAGFRYNVYHLDLFDQGSPLKISRDDMMRWKHFDILALPFEG